jgi:hypothetical protein
VTPPPDAVGEAEAWNLRLVGYHDLDKRPSIKMGLQVVDDRWYLYLGPLWDSGITILDVTDPANPELVNWIQAPANTWHFQVQVADGKMITGLERIEHEVWGLDRSLPSEEGIYIWDVADPVHPAKLAHWRSGHPSGTHRNYYDGGRYVHLTAAAPGFHRHIYRILDIIDPANPVEVGRWWLPEQWLAGGATPPQPFWSLHGPAYVVGDRAYLAYMNAGMVILDISDLTCPRLVSRLDFGKAWGSMIGVHTVLPLPNRNLVVVTTESILEDGSKQEPLNFAVLVDISDETAPRLISWLPVPDPPPHAPYANFHEKGGRFGPHNLHHWQNNPDLESRDDRLYLAYFNAGLRVFDISDAYRPREIAYYVPPNPTERRGLLPDVLVTQSEDVVVDRRGYIYVTDKNWGLHILEPTGDLAR